MPGRNLAAAALSAAVLVPSGALACGGLFCNVSQPVNQAAERILFAHEGGTIHMHVQIAYDGPPAEFGWLVPVPPGVETAISSEGLFQGLDRVYTPRFWLQTEFEDGCEEWLFDGAAGGGADAGAVPPPSPNEGGVQVLSREPVGPYDRAILAAEDVAALRRWLDENRYQIPENVDARLQPYIDAGAVFVALKLLNDVDAGDVVPLHLSFPADRPVIPITPTAVAAEPDMGVIVHVLGDHRAIPLNYRHVVINEAAIDWVNGGQNYVDVVSQAADEAGGHAFATDYAGPLDPLLVDGLRPLSAGELQTFEGLATLRDVANLDFQRLRDPDIQRVLLDSLDLPDGLSGTDFLGCPYCYEEHFGRPVDGMAVAARLREEVQPAREHLAGLFMRHDYLTRLFSTLSPEEMDRDPMFSFNDELPEVPAQRQATLRVPCREQQPAYDEAIIVLSDGRELQQGDIEANAIRRQDGATVRGGAVPAAARVEQLSEAGAPQIVEEQVPGGGNGGGSDAGPGPGPGGVGQTGDDDGCGCRADTGSSAPLWLSLLALVGLRRRRRGA